jgi:hypothetical protein
MNRITTLSIGLLACAPPLAEQTPEDTMGTDVTYTPTETTESSPVETVYEEITVDATDYNQWVYYHLGARAVVMVSEKDVPDNWDLAFRRFNIKLNGGVSGTGTVRGQVNDQDAFVDLLVAPSQGYVSDREDFNADGVPEYLFLNWYDYDYETHLLTPKDQFYVLEVASDEHYKFQHLAYYDEPGTSGMVTFALEGLISPDGAGTTTTTTTGTTTTGTTGTGTTTTGTTGTGTTTTGTTTGTTTTGTTTTGTTTASGEYMTLMVDATSSDDWAPVDLSIPEEVSEAANWQIAAQRYEVKLNSDLDVRAQMIDTIGFADLEIAPTSGYLTDEESDLDYVLVDWYSYDYISHTLTPKDQFYVIEASATEHYKLEFLGYYDVYGVSGNITFGIQRMDSMPGLCPVVYTVPGSGAELTCDDLVLDFSYTCDDLDAYAFDCSGCEYCAD